MITTTQCEHCGAAVEFELDNWQEGAVGDCPHCKAETRLRRVDIYAVPPAVAKNRREALDKLDAPPLRWKPVSTMAEVIFFLLGFFVTAAGAIIGIDGKIDRALVFGLVGVLFFGWAILLGHLRNIAEKPRE